LAFVAAQIFPDVFDRGVGAGLDKLGQFGLLPRREF
jgi:hypothetical protein